MIILEVDGAQYEGFTEISVVSSIRAISGSYSFGTTSDKKISLPIQMGQSCKVLIDKTPVVNGFIEIIGIKYGDDNHSLTISGRDKTMDVIDCATVIKELSGTLTLEKVIRTILDKNGLPDIEVINKVSGLKTFKDGDIQSAEIGETRFEYMEKYARKRQVLLTTDGNGNIVITRAGTINAQTALLNVVGGKNNNILSGDYTYDDTEIFHTYLVRSQQNPVALQNVGDIPSKDIVSQEGSAVNPSIRENRLIEIMPSQSGSNTDSTDYAVWRKNISKAKGFNGVVVVQGHYQDDEKTRLWIPNELVSVNDDFAGTDTPLNALLLIESVEYKESLEGTTTILNLVDKDTYSIQVKEDQRDARVNKGT